jgi:hypothetical protein
VLANSARVRGPMSRPISSGGSARSFTSRIGALPGRVGARDVVDGQDHRLAQPVRGLQRAASHVQLVRPRRGSSPPRPLAPSGRCRPSPRRRSASSPGEAGSRSP